jgi:tRNA pseudouridine55 synthase
LSQELFGIINVNKPKGFTSHDVVAKLRKILKIKQIGHTGTLDPMATGVLPVCVGKATKLIQYLTSSKAYMAYIKLGVETDTYDMEGVILEQKPVDFDINLTREFLKDFEGEITQTPPIYSAVHYKGKRLYEYARKNIEIKDIPVRQVTVNCIELVNIEEITSENPVLMVAVDCSEGTYIRSIAHDLGEKLGFGACLSGLIRVKAGEFVYENTKTLEEIEANANSGDFGEFLINPTGILPLKILEVEEDLLIKIKNGQSLYKEKEFSTEFIQLVFQNKLVGIAKIEDNKIKPVNVFI